MAFSPPWGTASGGMLATLASRGTRYWATAAAYALVAAAVIGIPTRVIPNPWFSRMTPTRPEDYAFLVASSALLGMTLPLRPLVTADPVRPAGSGFATFLAVGCPVCNKLVVALLGVGGALSWFAPIQPVLGLAAVIFLLGGLRQRLRTIGLRACALPASAADARAPGADSVALDV